MSQETTSENQPQGSSQETRTHVTLVFDRPMTDEEVQQLQLQHNAISALRAQDGHHDHDHPTLV
jgi:hypothetical protein